MSLIKNLRYSEGDFSLQVDELEIPDQGLTVLQGPSGSGKTTFINILIGLLQPAGWQWIFKNEALHEMKISERRLGVVFQSYDLFPHLTAAENIALILKSRHRSEDQSIMKDKVNDYVRQLGLEKCWNTQAEKLSGGEKQRVALLRAVVSKPRLLLLDEPFSALDEKIKNEARLTLKNFIQQFDIPALLVTHDLNDVELLAQHRLILKDGRIEINSKN